MSYASRYSEQSDAAVLILNTCVSPQTRIGRRHPSLGLPAAIAAEEALTRQQGGWVSSEEEEGPDEEERKPGMGLNIVTLGSQNPHVRRNSPLRSSYAPVPSKRSKDKEKAARQAAMAAAQAAHGPVYVMSVTLYDTGVTPVSAADHTAVSLGKGGTSGADPSCQTGGYGGAESDFAVRGLEADAGIRQQATSHSTHEGAADAVPYGGEPSAVHDAAIGQITGDSGSQQHVPALAAGDKDEEWAAACQAPRDEPADCNVQHDEGTAEAGTRDAGQAGAEPLRRDGEAHDAADEPAAIEAEHPQGSGLIEAHAGPTGEGSSGLDAADKQPAHAPAEDEHLQGTTAADQEADAAEIAGDEGGAEELHEEDGVDAAARHAQQLGESHGLDESGYADDFESMGISKASEGQLGQFGGGAEDDGGED